MITYTVLLCPSSVDFFEPCKPISCCKASYSRLRVCCTNYRLTSLLENVEFISIETGFYVEMHNAVDFEFKAGVTNSNNNNNEPRVVEPRCHQDCPKNRRMI